MAIPSRCARRTNCSLGAQHVVLGDAQGGGSASGDGEAPGTALDLVTRLVVHLSGDGVHPVCQTQGGPAGQAARRFDLRGDYLVVQHQRGVERQDARSGFGICPTSICGAHTRKRSQRII
jgi:hypothetical protein